MRKKCIYFILICLILFSLTGCRNTIPKMTEEEQVMVTNYAAALLLKYDSGYQSKLLNDEQLKEEEQLQQKIQEEAEELAKIEAEREAKKQEQENEEKAGDSDNVEEIPVTDPAEFLALDGITVGFGGVEYLDQYPNDGGELFFATNASEGCKLAVVHLVLSNTTSEVKKADVFSSNAKFKISFNNGDYHNTMATLFSDDFSVYQAELQPGASTDTVLIVDLKEEDCVDVQSVDLYIKANGQTLKTRLSDLPAANVQSQSEDTNPTEDTNSTENTNSTEDISTGEEVMDEPSDMPDALPEEIDADSL